MTLTVILRNRDGNVALEKRIPLGKVVPVNPIEDCEVSLIASESVASKIANTHMGNIPYCKTNSTFWVGDTARFIYQNMRGKTL
jgi:hypothetical protein